MNLRDIALSALAEDAAPPWGGEPPRSPTPPFDLQKFVDYLSGKED